MHYSPTRFIFPGFFSMRIDSFFVSLYLLLASLLCLLISDNILVCDVAYISALLSAALFTVDDWLDELFMKVAKLLFALSRARFAAKQSLVRTKTVPRFLITKATHPRKARQRWLISHTGRGIRHAMRHREAY